MSPRLTLSVAAATFLAALAALWLLRDVRDALHVQGQRLGALEAGRVAGPPPTSATPAPAAGAGAASGEAMTLERLAARLEEVDDAAYEYFTSGQQELYEIKKALGMLRGQLTRLQNQLADAHGFASSALPPPMSPLGQDDIQRLTEQAQARGVRVEPGRVTVRGFLNIAPNTKMPIEYFVTRFPEAGHETMVHVVGDKTLEEIEANPHETAKGLGLALYKGLLAAGFRQGEPTRPDPDSPRDAPRWLLPDGDTVYLYVRYTLDGTEHVVSATDWILDPETDAPLPDDAFRFTGSVRVEDNETGEETIAAELGGLLVSVWPNRMALLEVGLASATRNDYAYNAERIPQPKGMKGPLYLDLIFSRTRLVPGAAGGDAPPAEATPGEAPAGD
jgi:hypothetical protein